MHNEFEFMMHNALVPEQLPCNLLRPKIQILRSLPQPDPPPPAAKARPYEVAWPAPPSAILLRLEKDGFVAMQAR